MACSCGRCRTLRAAAAAWLGMLVAAMAGCPSASPPEPAPAPVVAPQGTKGQTYFAYEVRKGDTLYSLGRRFGVSTQEITADNHIDSPRELAVGTLLIIRRVEGAEVPAPPSVGPGPSHAEAPAGPRRAITPAELNRGKPGAQFWWPTSGTLTRRYGDQWRGLSDPGIAISAPAGTEVYAVADGTVVSCVRGGDAPESVWGNVVTVSHAGGMTSWYGHLANILVREGARVSKGEAIATLGATGEAPAPMLAFRLYHNERPVNPLGNLP